jgi:hypothetical protein
MKAMHTMVSAEATITTLTSTRIYVNRIPQDIVEAEDVRHPSKMLVLRMAGGAAKADNMHTVDRTVDAVCYGETDFEAEKVRLAVEQRFTDLDRETHDEVIIHYINPTGGPIPSVEADLVWPVVAQSFTVKANLKEV